MHSVTSKVDPEQLSNSRKESAVVPISFGSNAAGDVVEVRGDVRAECTVDGVGNGETLPREFNARAQQEIATRRKKIEVQDIHSGVNASRDNSDQRCDFEHHVESVRRAVKIFLIFIQNSGVGDLGDDSETPDAPSIPSNEKRGKIDNSGTTGDISTEEHMRSLMVVEEEGFLPEC
ncbi:hypothetical protein BDQ12DRAFT_663373 [Crucibulum laeve]|uniref:Uncharacterized protein n=1 Tax=Crucibulum laeve TaxID=68775 RepID=A0A5C3M9I8_9AGAR|nr:hypothetical protein BDQ12DRAFT_663373 [Crucibulum laeve]